MQANNMWRWLIPTNNDAIFFRNNLLLISKTHLNFCSFIQRIIWQINWSNLNSSLEIRNVLNIYIYIQFNIFDLSKILRIFGRYLQMRNRFIHCPLHIHFKICCHSRNKSYSNPGGVVLEIINELHATFPFGC